MQIHFDQWTVQFERNSLVNTKRRKMHACWQETLTYVCVQRGVAIETQAGKDIEEVQAKLVEEDSARKRSWVGWATLAVRFQRKDCMNITVDQWQENVLPAKHLAHLSHQVLIYRPGNNATRLSGEGKHFILSKWGERQTLLWYFESEVCTCLCKCVHA